MDAAQVLQTVLSVIQSGEIPAVAGATPSAAANGTSPPFTASAGASGASLPQLIFMLFSMAAIRDWVKLILFGGVIEASRRALTAGWERLVDSFWVTATFEFDGDAAGLCAPPEAARARG